ncbi:sterol transporter [Starmerella bacillaris]|uniref:Phosphatidylglycerol/phosphatidylinositol transfer protein n=1 Tax=Starmerella bacillaris TaxID=1247836 RepID=A0AAV5RGZ9_STABA|nr:sterol transporter [Starmerella bacillaris]
MLSVFPVLLTACSAFSFSQLSSYVFGILPMNEISSIPGNSPFELCNTENQHLLEIDNIYLDPYPPIPGENITITASGNLLVDVYDGAYVDVVVTYGFIILVNKRYDLCELLPEVSMECPVSKGKLSIVKTVEIPEEVPPGEYSVQAQAYTADDVLLSCLEASVDLE